ncbi:MAG: cytochrome c maturation protein CcmE [Chloroflexi bacterium]|nr:cytochrome c maturation protein CcmE [Chloroflexota bacterium]
MAESTWMKEQGAALDKPRQSMWKLVVLGIALASAVIFLIFNAVNAGGTQLYLTVDEFYAKQASLGGRDLRVSGWVVADTIQYTQIDAATSRLEFDIVDSLENPGQRLHIVAMNEPKPDLLQGDAQALVEGHAENGIFLSNPGGLLLKCPTRYEE